MYEPRTAACGAGMKSYLLEMNPHSRVIATKKVASHMLNLYARRLSPVAWDAVPACVRAPNG